MKIECKVSLSGGCLVCRRTPQGLNLNTYAHMCANTYTHACTEFTVCVLD